MGKISDARIVQSLAKHFEDTRVIDLLLEHQKGLGYQKLLAAFREVYELGKADGTSMTINSVVENWHVREPGRS